MKLRIWPDSIYGRLVLVLVVGMFAGQLFTGTIWFANREHRTLEIPARLFASRLADTVRLLDGVDDQHARDAVIARLGDARYRLSWVDRSALVPACCDADRLSDRAIEDLISGVVRRRLGQPVDIRVIDAYLRDDHGHHGLLSLFNSRMPTGVFHVQLELPSGQWLDIGANEGQAGMQSEPAALVLDYIVRIYLVRLLAVVILALIAVRFTVLPLRRLAEASESLGRNMHRAPLPVEGPAEVRSAARSFNAMQIQLTESIAARTRFLSAMSHDLRSPLTRLRLRAEMLPDPVWRERLRGDLAEMEAMVRATLDAVRGVEITEVRREIDFMSMIEGLVEDQRERGEMIEVTGVSKLRLFGFPRNLKRCLQNLIDNAVQYGQQVSVRIDDMEATIQIVVADRGPGMPDPVLLERVFEPYLRGNAAIDGTGLGLTIARSIAQSHGGDVILQNRAGGGLEAVLTLASSTA